MELAETVHLAEAVSLDEPGWVLLGGTSIKDTDLQTHRQMAEEAWKAYLFHPMGRRQADFLTAFVAGQGFGISADDQEAQPVVDAFMEDAGNRMDQAVEELARRFEIEGEVFVVLFQSRGQVQMREIEPAEIEEVITDPDDVSKPLYYWRRWTQRRWSGRSYVEVDKEQFIPALGATDADLAKVDVPEDVTVRDRVCCHLKFGAVSTRKRGVSPFVHLPWMRRFSSMLRVREDNLRARSSWVWDVSVEGDDKTVNAVKNRIKKPPRPGSTNVHTNKEVWEAKAPDVGAGDAKEDMREVKLMNVTGSGLPEHVLTGDASNGNYASSKVQDMPMLKLIEGRQKAWSGFWKRIIGYVITAAIKAGTVPAKVTDKIKDEQGTEKSVTRPIRITVTCTYPAIYTQSADDRVKEAQAARLWHEMGVSLRTIMADADFDYDAEMDQRLEEEMDSRRRSINSVQADVARDLGTAAARLEQPDETPAEPPSS
jgi:hypothetical protein